VQLYRAELENQPLFLSRIGELTGLINTTMLSWIKIRRPALPGQKRVYIALTDWASEAMQSFFDSRRT
jgi:hypothetical protein